MPPAISAGVRRPPRVKNHRRRPPVHRDRLSWLNARATNGRRVRRLSVARIGARPVARNQGSGYQLPLGIELLRAAMLVVLAVLAITVVLPALIALAAAASS